VKVFFYCFFKENNKDNGLWYQFRIITSIMADYSKISAIINTYFIVSCLFK